MTALVDEIRTTLEDFASAWKANDGPSLGQFFTDSGTLVNPFGQMADGRDAVTGMYSEYFNGMLAGTSTSIELAKVRDLGGGHAFVDAEQTILAPDDTQLLAVHLSALLERQGGTWRFADARPYSYAPVPA